MATSSNQRDSIPTLPLDEKIILTLEGYKKLFEKCEDTSTIFSCYETLYRKKQIKSWKSELESNDSSHPINRLFDFPYEMFPQNKQSKPDDAMSLVQFFSLLENVYRNVLLRPYIPAYRTINTDCGRYRSFLESFEIKIFEELNFEYHSPNLLTYKGTDQSETIKSAVACCILIVFFSNQRQKLLDSSSNNQQRNKAQ